MSTANISKKRKVCTLTARIVPGTIARHPRATVRRQPSRVFARRVCFARGSIDRLRRAERPTRPRTRRRGAAFASRAIDRSRVEAWSRVARGRGSRPDAVTVDAAFVRVLRARASEPSPSSSVVSPGRVR